MATFEYSKTSWKTGKITHKKSEDMAKELVKYEKEKSDLQSLNNSHGIATYISSQKKAALALKEVEDIKALMLKDYVKEKEKYKKDIQFLESRSYDEELKDISKSIIDHLDFLITGAANVLETTKARNVKFIASLEQILLTGQKLTALGKQNDPAALVLQSSLDKITSQVNDGGDSTPGGELPKVMLAVKQLDISPATDIKSADQKVNALMQEHATIAKLIKKRDALLLDAPSMIGRGKNQPVQTDKNAPKPRLKDGGGALPNKVESLSMPKKKTNN